MFGTAQVNQYEEQHAFQPGADRTLCGLLLTIMAIARPNDQFGSLGDRPLCPEYRNKAS